MNDIEATLAKYKPFLPEPMFVELRRDLADIIATVMIIATNDAKVVDHSLLREAMLRDRHEAD